MFFFILLLEESGYLPRAAFLLDRIMGGVGLSGRSFIPLLSSFACAIPGIMGMKEAGLANYNISFSFGLYAPSSWSAADVGRVFEAAVKVLQRADIREKLATQGMDPAPNASPADFKAANLREAPMWAQLIQASGAKVD